MSLPTDAKTRKGIPIYSGFIKYFPDAIAAVAELSRKGNDQHNPGKPLHWDRSKSSDELDAQLRHILDMASDGEDFKDTDDVYHATKSAWRSMANLQKLLERVKAARDSGVAAVPLDDGWREWKGGNRPVESSVRVHVRLREGGEYSNCAGGYYWGECGSATIVAWKPA